MPFLLLLMLTLACLPEAKYRSTPPEWLGVQGSILLTWSGVALVAGMAALLGHRTKSQLTRNPNRREQILRQYSTWRSRQMMGLIGVFGLALFGLGWAAVITPPQGGAWWAEIPGVELLILAPFVVGLVLSWAIFYDAERAIHRADLLPNEPDAFWSRSAYVGFHIRQNLAWVFVPLLLLVVVKNVPRLFPQVETDAWSLLDALPALATFVVVATAPWIMRMVLGLKPLPDGPLRTRLLAAGKRLNFRCSEILIWNTRRGMANAMLVGILPFLRYVILTDRLVTEMTPDEVEAVFGHEVGHVKHMHLLYYLAFLMASMGILTLAWGGAEQVIQEFLPRKDLATLAFGIIVGTYIVIVFGYLSRRCERQADVYGCRAVSCGKPDCIDHASADVLLPGGRGLCNTGVYIFINALEKVAYLNGISRDKPGWLQSWQHGTIAGRVDFLFRVMHNKDVAKSFQRRVGIFKLVLFMILGILLLIVNQTMG